MNALVLGLGAAAMDVVLQCDHLPQSDGFAFIHQEHLLAGGSCANVLATLTRLGTPTALVAQMGDDAYGHAFARDARQTGILTDFLFFRKGGTSLHTFITVADNGTKSIFAHMGDSLLDLSETDVTPAMLGGIEVFYTDLMPAKPALKLARLCRQRNIKVVFNLQAAPDFMALCGVTENDITEMLSLCDLFITFQGGLRGLTQQANHQNGARSVFHRYDPSLGVVVTLGEAGFYWLWHEDELAIPAFRVDARDTTGAGDAFAGGLIQALLIQAADRRQAALFASACAALKCRHPGPRFLANENQVLAFLEEITSS